MAWNTHKARRRTGLLAEAVVVKEAKFDPEKWVGMTRLIAQHNICRALLAGDKYHGHINAMHWQSVTGRTVSRAMLKPMASASGNGAAGLVRAKGSARVDAKESLRAPLRPRRFVAEKMEVRQAAGREKSRRGFFLPGEPATASTPISAESPHVGKRLAQRKRQRSPTDAVRCFTAAVVRTAENGATRAGLRKCRNMRLPLLISVVSGDTTRGMRLSRSVELWKDKRCACKRTADG